MEGFIVSDDMKYWRNAQPELAELIGSGKIAYRETIEENFAETPKHFRKLFSGENFGKLVVKVSDPQAKL